MLNKLFRQHQRLLLIVLVLIAMCTVTVYATRGDLFNITNANNADVFRITSDGDVLPGADNTYDLGSAAYSFNDAHIQGTATVGTLAATTLGGAFNGTVGATTPAAGTFTTLTATGNVTMNDGGADTLLLGAAADTVTVTSNTLSLTDDNWSVDAAGTALFVAATTSGDLAFNGNATFGSDGSDTITLNAKFGNGITFTNGGNKTIKLGDDSAADATAAKDLTIQPAAKTAGTGAGGNVSINAGASSGGATGQVKIGVSNTSGVLIKSSTVVDGSFNYAADTAANDAYLVALNPSPAAYTEGMHIFFKAVTANTGACSINVNSLGVKDIKTGAGADPGDNTILAGQIVHLIYDGTNFQLIQ